MSRIPTELKDKFRALTDKTYSEQAVWFLNGFWNELKEEHGEKFWRWVELAVDIDKRKKAGNDFDEFEAHRFLERLGETLTVKDMRKKFSEIDLDFNKRMAFIEYLIYKYNKKIPEVVNASQGDDTKLKKAEASVKEAERLMDETLKKLEEEKQALQAASQAARAAREAEDAAKASEAQAKKAEEVARDGEAAAQAREHDAQVAEEAAKFAEDAAKAAENEQKIALAELKAQEDAVMNKLSELERKLNDPGTGTVAKGKAKQEYEQLRGSDPLPLRKAKITQEATVRKFEQSRKIAETERNKATAARQLASDAREQASRERAQAESDRKAAEENRAKAEAARRAADEKQKAAEASTAAVARAVDEATAKFNEAMALLEEERKKPISPFGKIWWMTRELEEKKKYMPLSKGGVARK